MAFLGGVFDRAGDLVDGLSGKSAQELMRDQLAAQKATNDRIFQLEQERLKLINSPEYKAAEQKKMYMAFGVFIVIIVSVVILLRGK